MVVFLGTECRLSSGDTHSVVGSVPQDNPAGKIWWENRLDY